MSTQRSFDDGETRKQREVRSAEALATYLETYGKLVISYDDRIHRLVSRLGPIEPDQNVRITRSLLASRATNDLQAIWILASRGYALQACAAAATMFETAYRLTYVCSNAELAAQWQKHTKYQQSQLLKVAPEACPTCGYSSKKKQKQKPLWENIRECVDRVHLRYPTQDDEVENRKAAAAAYKRYSDLCEAKHSGVEFLRKVIEKARNTDEGSSVRHEFGPKGEDRDGYYVRVAIYTGLQVAGILCWPMIEALNDQKELDALVVDAEQLADDYPLKPFKDKA